MEQSKVREMQDVVIRFSGDSGDGMQLTGTLFSDTSALLGNGISTFPDYPAEIRAPQGTVAGVSGFQVHFGARRVTNPGDYTVMFEALKNGALDAVVCDGIVAQNYADTNGYVIMEQPLVLEENSVIIASGNEQLLAEVNNAIAQFKASDAYVDLQVKWGLTAAADEEATDGAEEAAPEESSSEAAA